MTFQDEIDKTSSERFVLARIKPSRFMSAYTESGGVYSFTAALPGPIATLKRNGAELTRVQVDPPTVADTFYCDDADGLVKVKLAAAPDDEDNIVVADYYLFYTSRVDYVGYETPDDSSTALRQWEPRLKNVPEFRQSATNLLAGVFSIDSTTLELENADQAFQSFITAEDSFNEKPVDIWLGVNDAVAFGYRGKVDAVSVADDSVTLSLLDSFSQLNQTAYMGDSRLEAYFTRESGSFPNMHPLKSGTPCRYIVGSKSRSAISPNLFAGDPNKIFYSGFEAVCINYTSIRSESNNREWALCRVGPNGLKMQEIGTIVRSVRPVAGTRYYFVDSHNLDVGDHVKWNISGTDYYGMIWAAEEFTYSGQTYNLHVVDVGEGYPITNPTAFIEIETPPTVAWKTSTGVKWLFYPRTYSYSLVTTSGGNKLVKITLSNPSSGAGTETPESYWGTSPDSFVDPDADQIYFRVKPADVDGHGAILKKFCEQAGMSTNADSFTAADAALPVNACFTIPYFDETSYDTYAKYAQDVLASTLGFLRVNDALEVEYNLIAAPGGAGAEVTRDVHLPGLSYTFDYSDIVTQIIAFNPHLSVVDQAGFDTPPSVTVESSKAKFLHGIERSTTIRHVLESIEERLDAILAVRSNRKAIYSFSVATALLEGNLGDDVTVETDTLPGGATSDNMKLLSIRKSEDSVAVEATDLEGL